MWPIVNLQSVSQVVHLSSRMIPRRDGANRHQPGREKLRGRLLSRVPKPSSLTALGSECPASCCTSVGKGFVEGLSCSLPCPRRRGLLSLAGLAIIAS